MLLKITRWETWIKETDDLLSYELSSTILIDILIGRDLFIKLNIRVIFHNGSFEFECPGTNQEITYIFFIAISLHKEKLWCNSM